MDRGVAVHWRRIAETILRAPTGRVAEIIETDTVRTSEFFGENATRVPGQFDVIEALTDVFQKARGG